VTTSTARHKRRRASKSTARVACSVSRPPYVATRSRGQAGVSIDADCALAADWTTSEPKLRYRTLYWLDVFTDEGQTDDGRVIYNASGPAGFWGEEEFYCSLRSRHYQSRMFGTTTACYDHIPRYVAERVLHKAQWEELLGTAWRLGVIDRDHPGAIEGDGSSGDVLSFCDPRPPGHDRH
jgi:hypothetical protein